MLRPELQNAPAYANLLRHGYGSREATEVKGYGEAGIADCGGQDLVRQINPWGHGRGCSDVADQDRKGKRSDQNSHD